MDKLSPYHLAVCYIAISVALQGAVPENTVSIEELRIRDELEAEIEGLEHEIIDSMCRLACHLQRLYQQRNIREFTSSVTDYQFSLPHAENALLLETNIRIKLDGQCRIDITKVEKDAATIQPNSCPSTDQSDKRSLNSCPSTDQSDKRPLKIRHSDAVRCRKHHNHPVVTWR